MTDHAHDDESEETNPILVRLTDDRVALVILNRPSKLNALDSELLEELFNTMMALEDDDEVGAIVITGSSEAKRPAFAAGADIAEMVELGGLGLRDYSQLGQQAFAAIESMLKPVVAAVNGFALGGGLELAMACHIRYAAESAKMGQPEVNLGIIPGFGGTQRLQRLVGRGRALEMLLTGDPIDAKEAVRIGLVNRVVPDADLLDTAVELAGRLASKAPLAVRLLLDAVQRGPDMSQDASLATETDLFGIAGSTEDVREGMRAFLEKRKPQWKGR
jgi:enoyl-CoA hydratase